MLDHPRSAIVVISSVLKFGLDPIYSFVDIAIFIFCRFGLKLPIHAHFLGGGGGGFGGIFPPNMVTHRSNPVKISPAVRPGRRIEKKGKDRTARTVKKVTRW